MGTEQSEIKKETFWEAMKRQPNLGEQRYFWTGLVTGSLLVVLTLLAFNG